MKNKFDIDSIRFLLHKYYEAETSTEEEYLLLSFFHNTPEGEIPYDLTDDARLFLSIDELNSTPVDIDVPNDLFEKITAITGIPDRCHKEKKHKNWSLHIVFTVAAACISLVLTFGIRWIITPRDSQTKPLESATDFQKEMGAQLSNSHSKVTTRIEPSTPPLFSKTSLPQEKAIYENNAEQNCTEEGFIEITDPEEAEKIMIEICRLLTTNTQKTNQAIRHLETTVDNYKELTKSIIQ